MTRTLQAELVKRGLRRIAIVGSRDFPNLEQVREFVRGLPHDTIVISGGARGVDRVAVDEATRRGMTTEVYPADWSKGKSAGFQRNATIVAHCDMVVAFWDGTSKGTAHTLQLARAQGKATGVIAP